MRKPAFSISENKGALQLRSNCAADQRLRFRHIDSTIPLLPQSKISSLWPSSVSVQSVLCRTWSETPKTGFLATRLIKSFQPHISDHSNVDASNLVLCAACFGVSFCTVFTFYASR